MNHVLPCYPSVQHHRTTQLSPAAALSQLESYLSASETQAHYHPDAVLNPGGVDFSAASGPKGNITISSLRRVAQGLAGEDLAPTEEEMASLEAARARSTGDKVWEGRGLAGIGHSKGREATGRGVLKKTNGAQLVDGQEEEQESEWQDPEEYALQQEVLEGEVGERGETVVAQQGEDAVQPKVEVEGKSKYTEAEKEARKAAKQERKKLERRKKEAQRAGA